MWGLELPRGPWPGPIDLNKHSCLSLLSGVLLAVASAAWLGRHHSSPPASHDALSLHVSIHLCMARCVHTFSFCIGYQSHWTTTPSDYRIEISTMSTLFTNSQPELLDMRISTNCLERTNITQLTTLAMKKWIKKNRGEIRGQGQWHMR